MEVLYSHALAQSAADAAITSQSPKSQLMDAIKSTCDRLAEFTTDDVLKANPELEAIDQKTVLGPAMKNAARNGWCVASDRYAASDRIKSHGRRKCVWRSLINN